MKEWIVGIIIFGGFIAFVVYLHYRFDHETFEEEKKFFDEVRAFNDSAEKLKEAIYDEIINPLEAFLKKIFGIESVRKNFHGDLVHRIRYVPWDKIFKQYPHSNGSVIRLPAEINLRVETSPKLVPPEFIEAIWKRIIYRASFSTDKDGFSYSHKKWLYAVSDYLMNFAKQDNKIIISIVPQVKVYQTTSFDTYKRMFLFGKTIWKKYIRTNYIEIWSLKCLTVDKGGVK